jgi:hypothetical protein
MHDSRNRTHPGSPDSDGTEMTEADAAKDPYAGRGDSSRERMGVESLLRRSHPRVPHGPQGRHQSITDSSANRNPRTQDTDMIQSNTTEGRLAFTADADLTGKEGYLVKLTTGLDGKAEVTLPTDVADPAIFVIVDVPAVTYTAGDKVFVEPLTPGKKRAPDRGRDHHGR